MKQQRAGFNLALCHLGNQKPKTLKVSKTLRVFQKKTGSLITAVVDDLPTKGRQAIVTFWLRIFNPILQHQTQKFPNFIPMGINNKISEDYPYFLTLMIENYIHNNPIKAELVERAEDYLYSSARDYAGEKGLVEIIMV